MRVEPFVRSSAAGNYDVLRGREGADAEEEGAPPPKIGVIKQTVTVPDLWNGELTTSSVIVASGSTRCRRRSRRSSRPSVRTRSARWKSCRRSSTKFTKKAELSTFMLIYNPKIDAANKPDVSVEYNFYNEAERQPEKFFNKTNPQNLNAQTLPPEFDFGRGHQLQSGQAVPLASFPEGDYRLEIKITDKIANKSLTRDVNFSVSAS